MQRGKMSILSTLLSYTNIVLLVTSQGTGLKKFAAYNGEREVLTGLEIYKLNGEVTAKMFEHPIETGAVITDHRILNPNTVSIQAYIAINDTGTLNELNYYYLTDTPLKIRAGNNVIKNAYLDTEPYEISGSSLDKTLYSISFKEGQEITPVYVGLSKARRASNASRVNSGQKQGKTVKRSWAFSALFGGRTN